MADHAFGVGAEFTDRFDLLDEVELRHAADQDWHRADKTSAQAAAERRKLAFSHSLKSRDDFFGVELATIRLQKQLTIQLSGSSRNPNSLVAANNEPLVRRHNNLQQSITKTEILSSLKIVAL